MDRQTSTVRERGGEEEGGDLKTPTFSTFYGGKRAKMG
jgi:hypothetical protein